MVYLAGDGLRRVKQTVTFKAEVMWLVFDNRGMRPPPGQDKVHASSRAGGVRVDVSGMQTSSDLKLLD